MGAWKAGKFITFEGIEGSGKSVQVRLLSDELERQGIKLIRTREPGGTPFGEELRKVLLGTDGPGREPLAELLLYLADRCEHLKEIIEPALRRGVHVISDRYHDATLAYQGHARGMGFEVIDQLARILELRVPDLTLILDLEVEIGLERACRRNEQEKSVALGRFEAEDLDFHRRVREGYQLLAQREPGRIELIDASGTLVQVFEKVLSTLDKHGFFPHEIERLCRESPDC